MINIESTESHAMCRFTAVTVAVIEAYQSAFRAGHDLSMVIPDLDAADGAVIVSESMEADALLDAPADVLFDKSFDGFSDWALAVLAQILFDVVRETARNKRSLADPLRKLETRAWTALERALDSPTASPLLWYEDIYFEVAQEYRMRGDPHALALLKRSLVHNLHFNEGNNADSILRDIAETYLWLDRLNDALSFYAALIRNEPDDIWHYNSIAFTFCRAGLPHLGIQATRRGQVLIETSGDPERLADQFGDSLSRLETCMDPDRTFALEPAVLADFANALSEDFSAGKNIPYPTLARELLPDLDSIPLKAPAKEQTLPPPISDRSRSTPSRSSGNRPHASPRQAGSDRSLGRNDPCWCGGGKKYKQCHLRMDRRGER